MRQLRFGVDGITEIEIVVEVLSIDPFRLTECSYALMTITVSLPCVERMLACADDLIEHRTDNPVHIS